MRSISNVIIHLYRALFIYMPPQIAYICCRWSRRIDSKNRFCRAFRSRRSEFALQSPCSITSPFFRSINYNFKPVNATQSTNWTLFILFTQLHTQYLLNSLNFLHSTIMAQPARNKEWKMVYSTIGICARDIHVYKHLYILWLQMIYGGWRHSS